MPQAKPLKRSRFVTTKQLKAAMVTAAADRADGLATLHKELTEKLASKDDLIKLGEKITKDVAPVVEWHKGLVNAARITDQLTTWSARKILFVASVIVALGIITGTLKAMLFGLIAWVTPK